MGDWLGKMKILISLNPTEVGQVGKAEGCKYESLEAVVDADIADFEEYFCEELKNDSLAKSERSIIKTYLWWKTHQENPSGEEERS
jgi:hypothetical protein